MNPELERNLWLELSPSRVALMLGVLLVIFGVAWLVADAGAQPQVMAATGEILFGLIVGLWGSFKAGRAVADEIRERTWDFQRLSALSPLSMTLGKLFGATAYVWFGGLVCLGVAAWGVAVRLGPVDAVLQTAQLILLGIGAHAVALGVSLAAVRRGRGKDRVDAFVYTFAGLAVFQFADAFVQRHKAVDWNRSEGPVSWSDVEPIQLFGQHVAQAPAALALLAVLVLWAVVTAWRLMRVELQAPANPLWYPFFLLAPALVLAARADTFAAGAATAYAVIHVLVLATAFVEPKDVVAWRSLMRELAGRVRGAGRYWPAALTGWLTAFVAAGVVAVAALRGGDVEYGPLAGFAACTFLARDLAIFAFFHLGRGQRRGDFAAAVTIGLLTFAGPAVFAALEMPLLGALFFVNADGGLMSNLLSIAAGAVQAVAFALAARGRWGARAQGIVAATA